MNNPINPINRPPANPINTGSAKEQAAKENTESTANNGANAQETVSLSAQSELKLHHNNASEVDSTKVEALKQEMAKGNYPLDPQKIAKNIINLEKSLIE